MAGQAPVIRLIPRLDIKGKHLIKGIHLEGLRKVGAPNEFAQRYYQQGAEELIYMDVVASLYGRNSLTELVKEAVKSVFIPITVGGGIRALADAKALLRVGADKIAINTAATKTPELINQMAKKFGSQSVVISIEAKETTPGHWQVYTDNGREKTGRNVLDWVVESAERGAGELLLTSIDREGTRQGFDLNLIKQVRQLVNIPIITSGGLGSTNDAVAGINAGANAIALADVLHFDRLSLGEIHQELRHQGFPVRPTEHFTDEKASPR